MQESSFKICPICEAANDPGAQSCLSCEAKFSPPLARSERPNQIFGPKALFFGGLAITLCVGLLLLLLKRASDRIESDLRSKLEPAPSPISLPTYGLKQADEKQSRTAPIKGMPDYAQVASIASKSGFQLRARGNADSSFIAEAIRFIDGQEFKFVVMGPASDRVDTIRIQVWGPQTKQARQQVEKLATQMLSSLNRGQLPRDVVRQLYAGSTTEDDGISNGYCSVQVLQKPINPGRPSAGDRITIDLIFDKTN